MTKKNKQLSDILDLLIDKTHEILTWDIIDATQKPKNGFIPDGLPAEYYSFDHKKLREIKEMVRPLLASAQETKKIKSDSIRDVTNALKNGKITIKEATDLIKLLNTKREFEDADDF